MAPEVILRENYGPKIDVWSSLVVVFILLTGEMPFYGDNRGEVIECILKTDMEQLLSRFEISEDAKSFLIAGLIRDQGERPSARQLLNHKWLLQDPDSSSVSAECCYVQSDITSAVLDSCPKSPCKQEANR